MVRAGRRGGKAVDHAGEGIAQDVYVGPDGRSDKAREIYRGARELLQYGVPASCVEDQRRRLNPVECHDLFVW